MGKYIIKRLLISVVILFFVAFIIYALMRALPTSYVENMARQKSMQPGSKSFEEWMEQLTAAYNMDKGLILGFFGWLGNMLKGNFGDSWRWTVPVVEKFHDTVWLSFVMGAISFVLELLIAIGNVVVPFSSITDDFQPVDIPLNYAALFMRPVLFASLTLSYRVWLNRRNRMEWVSKENCFYKLFQILK